jgi:amino acid adenylation domain-containing protein
MNVNDTKRDYPRDKCIHELFEAQVERTPDAVAVVFEDKQLTYRELNRRANQLAHYLQKLGVGPEALVGICMDRSLETVVAFLATLKAGGAYVPLDPIYPQQRIAFMLNDSQISLLLTQKQIMLELPDAEVRKRTVVCLDTDWKDIDGLRETNPSSDVVAENLAYVMYTSGSTGKPKGVKVPHRGILRLLFGVEYVQLDETQTFLQLAPISFDASTFEIWGALLHGARSVLFPARIPTPKELGDALHQHKITTLWLTASLFNTIINEAPEALSDIRQLLIGGEALSVAHVQRAISLLPATQIINGYGPTEGTTFTSCYRIPRQVDRSVNSIPIGSPISNTEVYLLDKHLQPVTIGSPGELYTGGDGLARGYLNRPELTAEKFLPNPFSEPGSRLYRTGDLARYLPDGNIEFLGRIDNQVKIRGFRIEPGEVEAMLTQHPSVQQVVVLAREDTPGDKRLVAYAVPDQDATPAVSELRSFLKSRLPEYMVPSTFVLLDRLPLTPNGKIDHAALPVPEKKSPELERNYLSPRTPLEEALTKMWSNVLGIPRVGINDNFLELGGHSLMATQLICRVRDTFQVELPLDSFFNSATVANLAQIIENDKLRTNGLQFTAIHPVPCGGDLPLSFSQRRVWFLQQLEPENVSYHFQVIFRLTGILNIPVLERSLSEMVCRHEILRTTFPAINGRPVQVIHDAPPFRLPVVNLQPLPEAEREAEVQRLIKKEIQRPFNLNQLPLIRWTLLKLSENEHLLVHVEHHLLHDGWSFNVFVRELMELYKAFSAGNPSPLPKMPIQFVDFALWEQEWLQSEAAKEQLAYWKGKLTGHSFLELPSDRPRPAVQSFRGAAPRMDLPLNLCAELRSLSRRENVTLFMTMLAAFVTLLHRYTGQVDFCVGSGVANRRWRETEGLIGMIINNIVLRNDLSGNPTVRELLTRVRDTTLEAYAHQDLPFDKVVEALQPKRELSHNPLFQVIFGFHDAPMSDVELPGLDVNLVVGLSNGSAKFDLNVIVIPHSNQHLGRSRGETDGLTLLWEYNTDLFDEATMTSMIGHYQRLLESMVADPERRISDFPMLTEAEKQQILFEWNDTGKDYPKGLCIHQLFEAQAERTPDAVAAVFEGQELTYRELNRRSNQLARYLRTLGVGPEVLVGICVERSLEMIIGLLGILKAGGAYVPLDPAYPKERNAFMLQDTQASVLLTQQRLVEELFEDGRSKPLLSEAEGIENGDPRSSIFDPQLKVVCLDTDWEIIAQQSDNNLVNGVSADNLAYVIYTSGSTGQPKGTGVPHRAVNRLVMNANYVNLEPTDVMAQVSNCSFDAATFEIWGALLHGAKLVLITTDVAISPKDFAEQIEQKKISVLFLTTALFNQMARELPTAFKNLRHLLFGGEAADPRWVAAMLEHDPPKRLLNLYGPTEATTFASWHLVENIPEGATTIPIGRPIANTEIFVLDPHFQPVPIGVPGELCIGGDGLARGYCNRRELTAEKFIPNSFSKEPGARLYKTGDLVRYLPDGNIEFLGRIDHQVKIRGFRIELGEIESALSQHSAVQQTVVLAREDIREEKGLVAYVVPNQQSTPTINDLRTFLKQKLPDYMVPSTFVMLDSLPLTPNGKVDRRALPAPDQSRPELVNSFVAPRTSVEEALAEIWAEVLNVEEIGIHDNFFELGGHSLLATQVISRVREILQLEVPLRALFENPTVATLAVKIAEIQAQKVGPKDTEDALADLELLSEEEAERLLVSEKVLKEI